MSTDDPADRLRDQLDRELDHVRSSPGALHEILDRAQARPRRAQLAGVPARLVAAAAAAVLLAAVAVPALLAGRGDRGAPADRLAATVAPEQPVVTAPPSSTPAPASPSSSATPRRTPPSLPPSGRATPSAGATPATAAPPAPRTSAPAPTSAPTRTPSPTPPAPCATAALEVGVEPGTGAAGSVITAVTFVNRGASACTLDGHPGVSFVSGDDGQQVGNAADRTGTPATVVLAPGAVAHADLRIVQTGPYDPADCRPSPVRGLRVFPPDQTAAVFVPREGTACAGTGITQLTVSPVEAGPPQL